MKLAAIAVTSMLGLAQAGAAQDGFYYGVGLGLTHSSTVSSVVPSFEGTATDVSLALTAGYRFASADNLSYGIEGNLDFLGGRTMSDSSFDACAGISPSWCEVNTVFRLRGTLTSQLASGSLMTVSLGGVLVQGVSENGPGNNLDTTGNGLSLGLGWEQQGGAMPMRIDVNYDAIRNDDQPAYDRELDMFGLRVSYMF